MASITQTATPDKSCLGSTGRRIGHRGALLSSLMVILCGCRYFDIEIPIIPIKADITAGHKYSGNAIKFLDAPDTTRKEVIATLGPPLMDSRASRVLLYTWQRTLRIVPFQLVCKDRDRFTGVETTTPVSSQKAVGSTVQDWGLFIAYTDDGFVCAHEVRRIGTSGLEDECVTWRRILGKNE